jgi:hypothetical protein
VPQHGSCCCMYVSSAVFIDTHTRHVPGECSSKQVPHSVLSCVVHACSHAANVHLRMCPAFRPPPLRPRRRSMLTLTPLACLLAHARPGVLCHSCLCSACAVHARWHPSCGAPHVAATHARHSRQAANIHAVVAIADRRLHVMGHAIHLMKAAQLTQSGGSHSTRSRSLPFGDWTLCRVMSSVNCGCSVRLLLAWASYRKYVHSKHTPCHCIFVHHVSSASCTVCCGYRAGANMFSHSLQVTMPPAWRRVRHQMSPHVNFCLRSCNRRFYQLHLYKKGSAGSAVTSPRATFPHLLL